MPLPNTRAKARELGIAYYFTGNPCPQGHTAARRTHNSECAECFALHRTRYRKDYYRRTRTDAIAKAARWGRLNPEKRRKIAVRWAEQNRTRSNLRSSEYRKANKAWYAAYAATRRSTELQATPPWLTASHKIQIQQFYFRAAELERITGVKMHVDHIQPLKGRDRSGLHVPWNLRILTATDNVRKSNKPPEREILAFSAPLV